MKSSVLHATLESIHNYSTLACNQSAAKGYSFTMIYYFIWKQYEILLLQ